MEKIWKSLKEKAAIETKVAVEKRRRMRGWVARPLS